MTIWYALKNIDNKLNDCTLTKGDKFVWMYYCLVGYICCWKGYRVGSTRNENVERLGKEWVHDKITGNELAGFGVRLMRTWLELWSHLWRLEFKTTLGASSPGRPLTCHPSETHRFLFFFFYHTQFYHIFFFSLFPHFSQSIYIYI